MMKLYKIVLLFSFFLSVSALSAQVKTNALPVDSLDADTDSIASDSLVVDSITLPWPQSMQQRLAKLLELPMLQTSQLGLMVYDLDADSVLFAHNVRQTMRPASTMKLITAIAALDRLGGSYQFKTELCYTGTIDNRTLTGDVYCVGGFDPRFNVDDMKAFVEGLHRMGVDTIRGSLYADKSMKDADRLGEGWCWDDDNPVLTPLPFARNDRFMSRFQQELSEAGIVVQATVDEKRKPADTYCIVTRFHTIDQILMRMMKESDNLYAEAMFYQLAAASGMEKAGARQAREAVNRLISKLGLKPSAYRIADGSGLSLYNYLSPELEVKFLRYAFQNDNIYLHLLPSLPISGEDGTLKNRMRSSVTRGKVRAKTGTVDGVSTLAGYCTAPNGHRLCFSIMNQGVMHSRNGRNFQDRVCTILCTP